MTRRPASPSPRRGTALVVVMAVLAAAVVLAIAFLQAQQTALRVAENGRAEDLARRAAEAGLAHALSDLQSPNWAGVGTVYSAEVGRDGSGAWSYQAKIKTINGDGTAAGIVTAAVRLNVTSTGSFLPTGSARPVERTMEAVLQLAPRVPVSLAATPSDRKPDSAFDPVQSYALFAGDVTLANRLPPQAKVVGDAYFRDKAYVYRDVTWPDDVRARAGADNPRPVTGTLSLYATASSADAANLSALLGVGGWRQTATSRALPAASLTELAPSQTYRVYQGGPSHHSLAVAATLDGTASNPVVLGPTDGNPLGLFYRSGDLTIEDNVRITGTLVVTGRLILRGPGISLAAVRPAATSGAAGTAAASASLPAVLCGSTVEIRKESSVTVSGAVYAATSVTREAVDRHAGTAVTIDGAVLTGAADLATPPMWAALSSSDWSSRSSSCPAGTPFLPWLANAGNWPLLFWPLNYNLYGLSNEPTFTVTRPADASYVLAPPLFRPDPAAWNAGGGYRWTVLAWREVTP